MLKLLLFENNYYIYTILELLSNNIIKFETWENGWNQECVGKTCIARRLCFNTFDVNTKETLGIEFYTKNLPIVVDGDNTFVRISIWDFGGREQFLVW